MSNPLVESWRQPNTPIILPDELISEVLSLLDVKSLMRMRCVSKSWNSLISHDPSFIKMHLKKSARNKNLTIILVKSIKDTRVASFPLLHLLENQSMILADDDPYYQLTDCWVVGSCNGILCLLGQSYIDEPDCQEHWLFFWNPATRAISEKLGYYRNYSKYLNAYSRFSFGYDNSTDTYKVVALHLHYDRFIDEGQVRMGVRVFSLGENVWKNIQSFPVIAFGSNAGVHLSGTLSWLALSSGFKHSCWKVVIISLDLATETHRQLPLPPGFPPGFDEAPPVEPTLSVLMDCLCFSHDFKRTHFVIWQMMEFGVGESWTQFLKIGYQNLQYDMTILRKCYLVPLYVSENCDILIWTDDSKNQAILYNWRDNRVKGARINDAKSWFIPKDYVESLVSPF